MGSVGTGTSGTRFLKTNWPIEDGLTAGTQKQTGHKENLEAQEVRMEQRFEVGL